MLRCVRGPVAARWLGACGEAKPPRPPRRKATPTPPAESRRDNHLTVVHYLRSLSRLDRELLSGFGTSLMNARCAVQGRTVASLAWGRPSSGHHPRPGDTRSHPHAGEADGFALPVALVGSRVSRSPAAAPAGCGGEQPSPGAAPTGGGRPARPPAPWRCRRWRASSGQSPRGPGTDTGSPGPQYWQQWADYRLEAELNPVSKRLTGQGTITYHNRSPDTLNAVYVQLLQQHLRAERPA